MISCPLHLREQVIVVFQEGGIMLKAHWPSKDKGARQPEGPLSFK
jgi:hypothetical protein